MIIQRMTEQQQQPGGGWPAMNGVAAAAAAAVVGVPQEGADTVLLQLVQTYDWAGILARVASHPSEARSVGVEERTPLQMACEQDAPAVVVESLLKAFPEASTTTIAGTSSCSDTTPLHSTCSSPRASVHVVRALLEFGLPAQVSMRDSDGDTPLHAACRCGASVDVLNVLVGAYPAAVDQRDREGLTPLLRLWVRCFVMCGADAIDGVRGRADLTGELGETWEKTALLLLCSYLGAQQPTMTTTTTATIGNSSDNSESSSSLPSQQSRRCAGILHAASAVDCPRAVLKIASVLYPDEIAARDGQGRTPLMVAAQAPVFEVRDLSDEGYALSDEDLVAYEDGTEERNSSCNDDAATPAEDNISGSSQPPSVIRVLLQRAEASGKRVSHIPDNNGSLPLHVSLIYGKKWFQGVEDLVESYPEALAVRHNRSQLYPFLLAAAGSQYDLTTIFELTRRSPSFFTDRDNGKSKPRPNNK